MKDNRFNPPRRPWPRWGVSPTGDRAVFDYLGALPPGWKLEVPLPGTYTVPAAAKFVQARMIAGGGGGNGIAPLVVTTIAEPAPKPKKAKADG